MNDSKPDPIPPSAWRALLLHRLDEVAATALEQRLLDEPGALVALQDAENDLFDDYARGQLSREERLAFEQHRLTSGDAGQRLRFSRALQRATGAPTLTEAAERSPPRRTRFNEPPRRRRRGLIGGAVVGSALAAGLAVAVLLLPRGLGTSGSSAQTASRVDAQTLVLLASVERGAPRAGIDVVLEPGATQLRVQAEVDQPDDTARYRLMMFAGTAATADEPVLRIEHLPLLSAGRYRYVEAMLPVTPLAAGPRTIRVEAEAPAAPFAFDWTLDARPAPGR